MNYLTETEFDRLNTFKTDSFNYELYRLCHGYIERFNQDKSNIYTESKKHLKGDELQKFSIRCCQAFSEKLTLLSREELLNVKVSELEQTNQTQYRMVDFVALVNDMLADKTLLKVQEDEDRTILILNYQDDFKQAIELSPSEMNMSKPQMEEVRPYWKALLDEPKFKDLPYEKQYAIADTFKILTYGYEPNDFLSFIQDSPELLKPYQTWNKDLIIQNLTGYSRHHNASINSQFSEVYVSRQQLDELVQTLEPDYLKVVKKLVLSVDPDEDESLSMAKSMSDNLVKNRNRSQNKSVLM